MKNTLFCLLASFCLLLQLPPASRAQSLPKQLDAVAITGMIACAAAVLLVNRTSA